MEYSFRKVVRQGTELRNGQDVRKTRIIDKTIHPNLAVKIEEKSYNHCTST